MNGVHNVLVCVVMSLRFLLPVVTCLCHVRCVCVVCVGVHTYIHTYLTTVCDETNYSLLVVFFAITWVFVLCFHWVSQSVWGDTKIFLYYVQMVLLFFGEETGMCVCLCVCMCVCHRIVSIIVVQ